MMKKPMFGKGFAKAMAGAGAAAAASGAGWAAEGQSGVNAVTVTSTGGSGAATVSVTGVSSASGKTGNVVIVGSQVWIDGVAIPEDAVSHSSASGRTYKIHRDNGRVSVTSE